MIQKIKNWFKKKDDLSDFPQIPLLGTSTTYNEVVQGNPALNLEEKTFKIFQATKVHPAIDPKNYQSFLHDCKTLLENEVFNRVIDEVMGEYAEKILQSVNTLEGLLENRYKTLGADEIRKRLREYANSIEPKEDFNQYETI